MTGQNMGGPDIIVVQTSHTYYIYIPVFIFRWCIVKVEGHGLNNHMRLPYGRLMKCELFLIVFYNAQSTVVFKRHVIFY